MAKAYRIYIEKLWYKKRKEENTSNWVGMKPQTSLSLFYLHTFSIYLYILIFFSFCLKHDWCYVGFAVCTVDAAAVVADVAALHQSSVL